MKDQAIDVYVDADEEYDLAVTKGAFPWPITGWTFNFSAVDTFDAAKKIEISNSAFTITGGAEGLVSFKIAREKTKDLGLKADELWRFSIFGTDLDGEQHPIAKGKARLIVTAGSVLGVGGP